MDAVRGMVGMSPDKSGVWGYPTSTLDWCEENYVVTPYIAEFWNTISNLVMIIPPIISTHYYWKIGMEFRYVILNVALVVVGIGSWLFHMTLQYEMQLLDELPMIYGTASFIYVLHRTSSGPKDDNVIDMVIPISYCITVSIIYLTMKNPLLHEVFYGCLVFLLIGKSIQVCKLQPAIAPYAFASFVLYLIGFIFWNVDNIYCDSVRHVRYDASEIFSPITQLHAWWHLFSGVASSMQIMFCAYARALQRKQKSSIRMLGYCWPYLSIHEMP